MWVSPVKDKESEVTHQSKWCSWDLKSRSLGPEPVILEPLPLPGFKRNYKEGLQVNTTLELLGFFMVQIYRKGTRFFPNLVGGSVK